MKKLLFLVIILLNPMVLKADIGEALESVVKVYTDKAAMTGVCYKEDGKYYYILSAGHGLKKSKNCFVRSFYEGYESHEMRAEVIKLDFVETPINREQIKINDLAVIRLSKRELQRFQKPKVIPLAKSDFLLETHTRIFSAGSPYFKHPVGWFGHINRNVEDNVYFSPKVAPGQSGSPLFNREGTVIVGIIVWYIDNEGVAVGIKNILESPVLFE